MTQKCLQFLRRKRMKGNPFLSPKANEKHNILNICYLFYVKFNKSTTLFHVVHSFSRNSAVFYWKSANLIGPPTVFYPPIEDDRARVAL